MTRFIRYLTRGTAIATMAGLLAVSGPALAQSTNEKKQTAAQGNCQCPVQNGGQRMNRGTNMGQGWGHGGYRGRGWGHGGNMGQGWNPNMDQSQGFPPNFGQSRGFGQGFGQGMQRGWRMGMQGQRGFMRRFSIVDENSDDRIGADEAAAWRESVFAAMDADDDGELTLEEYMTVRMGNQEGRNPQRQAMRQEQKKARFAPMDKDTSGKVSMAEFMAAGKAAFARADADGDGTVTPWEFRSHRRNH